MWRAPLVILCHVSLHQSVAALPSPFFFSLLLLLLVTPSEATGLMSNATLPNASQEWYKYSEDTPFGLKFEVCPETPVTLKKTLASLQARRVWMATLSLAAQRRGRGWKRN